MLNRTSRWTDPCGTSLTTAFQVEYSLLCLCSEPDHPDWFSFNHQDAYSSRPKSLSIYEADGAFLSIYIKYHYNAFVQEDIHSVNSVCSEIACRGKSSNNKMLGISTV